eukprot:TRINITY_DN47771_c0_g2_i1.p1 TRINITY_DN47771_c0_g2~~TRINITY_DN47771_c0_g2_i1.p1  ORF type:complete len:560 (+),score=54.50 TRINITY_DN47771_c0_g2_i1:38-1717(+)
MHLLLLSCFLPCFLSTTYYISPLGNDTFSGDTPDRPFYSADPLAEMQLKPGDRVLFEGGSTHLTWLPAHDWKGTKENPIVITSYSPRNFNPHARASIQPPEWAPAIQLYNPEWVTVDNLEFVGIGPMNHPNVGWPICGLCAESNATAGRLNGIQFTNIISSGFRVGVSVFTQPALQEGNTKWGFNNVLIENVHAYNQLEFGIRIQGGLMAPQMIPAGQPKLQYTHSNIVVRNCTVHDISGNPGGKGQGRVTSSTAGQAIRMNGVDGGIVTDSVAYNVGWTNGFHGNGGGGIWAFIVNNVVISHCVAHHIYNGKVGIDGNGFGLDGGCRNSVIEYCLSYLNDGVGQYIDEYANAPKAANNTIRYCVSYHDGQFGETAGIVLWEDPSEQNTEVGNHVYGNTVITGKAEANRYWKGRECKAWNFCLVNGKPSGLEYPWYNAVTSFRNTTVMSNLFLVSDGLPSLSFRTSYPKSLKLDHNAYYTMGDPFSFQWGQNMSRLTTGWDTFKKLSGFEKHGTWSETAPQNVTWKSQFFNNCVKWESYYPLLPEAAAFTQARGGFGGC